MTRPSSQPEVAKADAARGAAEDIVRRLREHGHVAYLAGGCVRDAVLGRRPKDYDVATDAHPQTVRQLFRRSRYVGEAFGVVLVHAARHLATEVATFRAEAGYSDRRRPDRVSFTDAREDARRRDFTVNGLFLLPDAAADVATPAGEDTAHATTRDLPRWGRVIDFVGGLADLESGVIRAIGDASERFAEDYLRMLRAARFAARLGFALDDATAKAIVPLAKYLGQISRERIGAEALAMLLGPDPLRAATLIEQLRLDLAVFNEEHREATLRRLGGVVAAHGQVATKHQATDKRGAGNGASADADIDIEAEAHDALAGRLIAWAMDRHDVPPGLDAAAAWCELRGERVLRHWRRSLCLSNTQRDAMRDTMRALVAIAHWPDLDTAARKRQLARPGWQPALALAQADAHRADAPHTDDDTPADADADADNLALTLRDIERQAAALREQGVQPDPLITGQDLIDRGLTPGPRFGQLLHAAYDAQLRGDIANASDAAAWLNQHA